MIKLLCQVKFLCLVSGEQGQAIVVGVIYHNRCEPVTAEIMLLTQA